MADFRLVNYQGECLLPYQGCVTKISESKTTRYVVLDLPTADYDVIQNIGTKNRVFTIEGVIISVSGVDWLRTDVVGYTGSISGSDDKGQIYLPQTQVFYTNVTFRKREGRPFDVEFTLQAVEVK